MTWPSPHMFFVHVHQSSKSFGRTTSAFLRSFSRCTWDRRVFNQRTPETPRHSQDGNLGVRRVLALAASTSFQNPANLPTPANSKGAKKCPLFQGQHQLPNDQAFGLHVREFRNKNVEILPRKHSRTLVQVESISTGCCDKKGPSTILWYYVLDSKMCKNIHSSKFKCLCTSRGHTQRFARFCSSLGVPKPCVFLHFCASKSKKHQMQTVSKTLKHCYLHWFLSPALKRYC